MIKQLLRTDFIQFMI